MKKIVSVVLVGIAVFALSGCAGGDGGGGITNSIYMAQRINHQGYEQKIYYHCHYRGSSGEITEANPDFVRDRDDICDFDLHGREEANPNDNQIGVHYVEGRIYLTDEQDLPWDGQDYSCEKPYGNDSVHYITGPNGFIDQASNYYRCTIYFRD
jgi:hypothetical protein